MVDSMPTSAAPPSSTHSTAAPNSRRTCSAVVAETRPYRLAEGAAMPPPKRRRSCCATGCDGTRTRDRVLSAGHEIAHARRALEHQRQRPGPEPAREPVRGLRHLARPVGDLHGVGDVHDHRVLGGPALGLVDPPHRRGIGGIGAEAVDGLGGKRDQAAGAEDGDGVVHVAIADHGKCNRR